MLQHTNIAQHEFKNARLAKVLSGEYFQTLHPVDQEIFLRICRGVQKQNVRADRTLDCVMEGNFVERYRTKLPQRSQKIKLLLVVVVYIK